MQIEEIIERYPQFNKDETAIITITTNHYDYGFKPTLELNFYDVFKDDKEHFITKDQVEKLKQELPKISTANNIIVGCDAGISRSPAVAYALAVHFQDHIEIINLHDAYPYMNSDIFDFIHEELK